MSVAILGSLSRASVRGVNRWCAAYVLLVVVSAYLLFVGDQYRPASVLVASILTFASVALIIQGTRQFFGLRPVRLDESLAFVAAFVVLAYLTVVSPNVQARVIVVSAVLAYGRLAVGTLTLRHAPRDGALYGYRFITVVAYAGALVHIARAITAGLGDALPATYLQPGPWGVVLLGLAIVTLPCMSIGMTMLAHDQLVRRMEKLATVDELTGALMRRAFMTKANLLRGDALTTGAPLSIAILDIDNFKAINDGFGHAAGDRTLTHFASVVSGRLRSCDLFGRIGGEEFGILFTDTRKSDAEVLTNALRVEVEQSASDGVRCTLSAGVACITAGDTLEGAMARADIALYMAKAMGRNRVITAPDIEVRKAEAPTEGQRPRVR